MTITARKARTAMTEPGGLNPQAELDQYTAHEQHTHCASTTHKNGVWWYDAPLPVVDHQCKPHTRGYLRCFTLIERCACGARRLNGRGHWTGVNERRNP